MFDNNSKVFVRFSLDNIKMKRIKPIDRSINLLFLNGNVLFAPILFGPASSYPTKNLS
jgi:hypothetical protein